MTLNLETPLSQLPRIGKRYFKVFQKLGLLTVRDLLYYPPHRYDDFSNIVFMESKREKTIAKEVFHSIELMKRYSKTILSVLVIVIGLIGVLQVTSLPLALFGLISIPSGLSLLISTLI